MRKCSTKCSVYNRFLKYTAKHQIYTCKSRLFVHFFAITATAWLRREAAYNIMFYGGREHWATTKFSFSIWNWIYVVVYRNSTSGKFTNIWQSKWVGDKVGELLHDPYFITFGHVLLDKNLGSVDSIYQRFENLQILEFDFFIARKIQSRVSAKVIKFCYWPLQKIP